MNPEIAVVDPQQFLAGFFSPGFSNNLATSRS
jgi:hypothetical protein